MLFSCEELAWIPYIPDSDPYTDSSDIWGNAPEVVAAGSSLPLLSTHMESVTIFPIQAYENSYNDIVSYTTTSGSSSNSGGQNSAIHLTTSGKKRRVFDTTVYLYCKMIVINNITVIYMYLHTYTHSLSLYIYIYYIYMYYYYYYYYFYYILLLYIFTLYTTTIYTPDFRQAVSADAKYLRAKAEIYAQKAHNILEQDIGEIRTIVQHRGKRNYVYV